MLTFVLSTVSYQGQYEEKLIQDLFEVYEPLSRPVSKENESLEVDFGLSLLQIVNVVRSMAPVPVADVDCGACISPSSILDAFSNHQITNFLCISA